MSTLAKPTTARLAPTPLQRGMLFDSILAAHSGVHIVQLVVRSPLAFDVARLESAFAETIARHELMRASFLWEGIPMPALLVHQTAILRVVRPTARRDLSASARLDAYLQGDRARPLDLSVAPAMRLALIDLSEDRAPAAEAMVWTLHHALLDGRSFGLVLEEIFARYDGQPVSPRPASFRDHTEALARLDHDASRSYWERTLRGATPTPLASARAGGPPGSPHREVHLRVSRAVVESLEALGRDDGLTANTFVQAAWALLLARHNRTDDVVFAATRSGRHTIPGASASIGCFINTLPVRVWVDGLETTRALVRRVREAHVEVRPFEESSASDVNRWSGAPPGTSLTATHVVFERTTLERQLREAGGPWDRRSVSVHEQGSLPVTLAVYQDDGLLLSLEHDPAALTEELACSTLRQLAHLLTSFSAGIDGPVDDHALLDPDETRAVLARTQPVVDLPSGPQTIVAMMAASVSRARASTAIRDGARSFTYAELDAHANRLARQLVDHGVRRGEVIAICMPRCAEWAVAMLAVAKCGAAFVPIDPDLPRELVPHMLEGASVRTALIAHHAGDAVSGVERVLTVTLAAGADPGAPVIEVAPTDLAYVLYTSGSTGRPKAVAIEHGALLAHAHAFTLELGLVPTDRCLQFTSVSFDVSLEEVFPTWRAGACVVLRSEEMARSTTAFLEGVARERITVLNLPTGFFHELVHRTSRSEARLPSSVRALIVGGETVQPADLASFRGTHPHVRWLNGYGPTEATITATVFDPSASEPGTPGDSIPIGRPLANARAYVLDPWERVLPIGCVGELHVGGASVARGYLGQDDLTARRFHPDPFASVPGARMYATGDMARVLPSGAIELLGRGDRQVKIRGFRIELEGVEATLTAHPGVRRAVCVVRPGASGDPTLVAYYVRRADGDGGDLGGELLKWLRAQLPAYAVPASLVELDSLPATTSGKIDMASLPPPPAQPASASSPPPREAQSALERDLLLVWADAFARSAVRVDDDFFDLGGHSLLAIRLVDEIKAKLGAQVGLAQLLGARTVAQLARTMVPEAKGSVPLRCIVPLQTGGSRVPIFGVHVLGLALSYYRPLARHLGAEQPVYCITFPFDGSADQPTRVEDLAKIYVDELRLLRPSGPYVLCAVSLGGMVAFEMGRQLSVAGHDVTLFFFDVLSPEGMERIGALERARKHVRRLAALGPGYLKERFASRARALMERGREGSLHARKSIGREIPREERIHAAVTENIHLAKSYQALPSPLRIVQFRAQEDVFYTDAYAASGLGWRSRALRGLEVVDVPGEHLTMLAEPHVVDLSARVREWIDRVHGGASLAAPAPSMD